MKQSRIRLTAAAAAAAFAVVACGGSENVESSGEDVSTVEITDAVAVDPAADLATNLLPDLVVDNLNDDNKVNLRNYGVGDKPILLWMWAPH
jgi:ABC-type oligopeptide transport system substrate-binding subunit